MLLLLYTGVDDAVVGYGVGALGVKATWLGEELGGDDGLSLIHI